MKTLASIVTLSAKSLANRKVTACLTIFAIAMSVALLLGVEKIKNEAKLSFANTISGTDLVVGARSGSIQLLLYSVFRIGNATNNVSWRAYEAFAARREVAWTIPISLGDSHQGFRVLGTTNDYFKHYRFGRKQLLSLKDGNGNFADIFDTVLGADVANQLGYKVGDNIVVAHGLGQTSFANHTDKPFKVVGILQKTGTPVDRTVHVSLDGIEAIHIDWKSGSPIPGMQISADEVRKMELKPKSITAFMVGLKSKLAIFSMQRRVNDYRREPLLAILPGVALQEFWDLMNTAEAALSVISISVVVTGLLVMLAMLFASLNERRREMSILRSVGARPIHIFSMLVAESGILALFGIIAGTALLYIGLLIAQPIIDAQFGLYLVIAPPGERDLTILATVLGASLFAGAIPAFRAYRQSLADGMMVRT